MLHQIEIRSARIISYLFHPLLLSTYAFLLMFNIRVYFSLMVPDKARWMILTIVFITTFLLPAIMTFGMKKLKLIGSAGMKTREERLWPFAVTTVFYYLCYYMLKKLELPPAFNLFLLGSFLSVAMALVISFFWKISIHMMGIGGLTGAFISFSNRWMVDIPLIIMGLILLSGLIGFARLKLQAHSLAQIAIGFVAGFAIFMFVFLL